VSIVLEQSRGSLESLFRGYYPNMKKFVDKDPWNNTLFVAFEISREDLARARAMGGLKKQGLSASYYRGTEWKGTPAIKRIDPAVLYAWSQVDRDFEGPHPSPLLPLPGAFSITWKGKLLAPATGQYMLGLKSEEGSSITLDGKVVLDNIRNRGLENKENYVQLTAGAHPITVKYFSRGAPKSIEMYWRTPTGEREIIPPDNLRPE
jgi:alpha-L-fucosidase